MENETNNQIIPVDVLEKKQTKLDLGGQEPTVDKTVTKYITKTFDEQLQDITPTDYTSDIGKLMEDIGITEKKVTSEAIQEAMLPEKRKQLRELDLEVASLNKGLRDYEMAQYQNPQLVGEVRDRRISEQRRQTASLVNERLLTQALLQSDYEYAKDLVADKVELELAPKKAELERLKLFQENNKDLLSKVQQAKLDRISEEETRAYEEEKKRKQDVLGFAITLSQNQAPQSLIDKANSAETVKDLLKIPGVSSYLMSPKDKLELSKLGKEMEKLDAEILELKDAREFLSGSTGDPIEDIILGSTKYGDKRLTDTQLEKIQQATNALGSLEALQGLLVQGKDGVNLTGPVKGRVRNLVTQLGGDADAKAINATIQGLIPTIARGIFGEVGVLTDADIENYKKTVPNLTSSDAQNKLVAVMMYDVLSRSIKTTLTTNAQNQTNVAGFLPTYRDINQRIGDLKSELGVFETDPIDPVNEAKMEASWSNQPIDKITNALDSFMGINQ